MLEAVSGKLKTILVFKKIEIQQDYVRLLLAWLLVMTACKGIAVSGGYAVDDYVLAAGDNLTGLICSQERYLQAALLSLIEWASLSVVDLGPLAVIGTLVLHILTVGSILRFLSIDVPYKYMFGAGSIMLVHPYTAEIYTWRLAMVAFSVALLSISVTLEMVRAYRGIATTVAAAIIVVLGLLTYQVVLNFLVTVLVCSTVIVCLLRVSGRHRDRLRVHETRTIDLAKVLALSVLIYSIVTYSLGHVLHVTADGRANLIPLSGAIERFYLLLRTLTFVFWRTEIIFPKWLKCLQLLFILAVPVSLGLFSKWRRLNVTYLRRLVLLMMVSTCLVPSSLGVIIFFDNWWPVPRAISHVAVIIGVLYWLPLYYGYIEQQGMNRVQSAIRVVLGIFVVGCIGVHTRIFADQRRMNAWDAAMGNRIISRLEILPNFGNIEAVHFVGSFYRYPSGPYTIQGDMNISSLGLIGLNTYVLNMVSGYHWRTATSEERIQAQALCQRSEKWPAPTSVMIVDKMAVVCLPTAS